MSAIITIAPILQMGKVKQVESKALLLVRIKAGFTLVFKYLFLDIAEWEGTGGQLRR